MKNFQKLILSKHASKYRVWGLGIVVSLIILAAGCAELDISGIGDAIEIGGGVIKAGQKVNQANKSFQTNPSEQEYYLGRAVAATIAGQYDTYNSQAANDYINLLGQTLAQVSDRPETFVGYRFQILDSDEINAFSAPGGFIFVTRGILRCAQHEDAVAAVLAHEIGHIQHKHGLRAIRKSRFTSALASIGFDVFAYFVDSDIANLVGIFENSITDITTTLINNGYSRAFEREADEAAVTIMQRMSYDPNGLVDMLRVMEERLDPGGKDFAKTHPSPASRIDDIQKIIGGYTEVQVSNVQQARFNAALKDI